MDNKECPKCHAKWPKCCKYCICGAKLPDVAKEFLDKIRDVTGLEGVFKGETDGQHKDQRNYSKP